jgi:O-antigen/teichoic acid export membrane protein
VSLIPRPIRTIGSHGRLVVGNVVARAVALVSLAVSTVLVARVGGATAVGVMVLLRVLPGLVGVLVSGGLPGAVAYFLAGPAGDDRRLRVTIASVAVASGLAGTLAWTLATPLLHRGFFRTIPVAIVAWAGVSVLSQQLVATAKACSQGSHDLIGANRVIVFEELAFLPAYGALLVVGVHGYALLVAALVLADVSTAAVAWGRLAARGFFDQPGRPSFSVAAQLWSYGMRGQIGGMLTLLNLRLDFALLGAFAGPAIVGTYAVASKFAELLRIPSLAINYVLYPRFAAEGREKSTAHARALLRPAASITLAAALPLALAAGFVLPIVYGAAFHSAIAPAHILLVGLAFDGAGGVVSAFLYGNGRPGLNSLAMGTGVVVTVALDALLIPRVGAVGAAIASSTAYLTTTAVLLACFWSTTRTARPMVATTVRVGGAR